MFLLLACADPEPTDTYTFEETLAPEDVHILVSSDVFSVGHAISEFDPQLNLTWYGDVEAGSGALGAIRMDDGDTVFAHIQAPPVYLSAFERMDPEGNIVWSYDELTAIGFSHGVGVTRNGTYVGIDTVAGRILAFDEAGTLLWEVTVSQDDEEYRPNGLSVLEDDDGTIRIATTLLERSGTGMPDLLALWSTQDASVAPELVWRSLVTNRLGEGAWPHGPRLAADGTLTVCQSANGQVVGYDLDSGLELWRVPETGAAAQLVFPRDALFLEDGSMLVADGAAELVRVADPFASFTVVGAVTMPGIFGLNEIRCGEGGGLPCLGD